MERQGPSGIQPDQKILLSDDPRDVFPVLKRLREEAAESPIFEDYMSFAQLRLAAADKFLPEILNAASQSTDALVFPLVPVDALIGVKPQINSKFLLDPDIVQTRLAIIETLLPVFAALAANPQVEKYRLRDFSKLLNFLTEDELFPNYLGSEKIPTPDSLEDRFKLSKQMVNLYLNLATHPNADCYVLETAMVNSLSICQYRRFDHQQKTELLKETIPVLTAAAIHPAMENVSRDQLALDVMKLLFKPEYPIGEKLTKEDRLSLSQDVIKSVVTIISKGKRELYDYDIRRVFETLKSAVFADEYSSDEKLSLLQEAMPVLKLIAEKDPQPETINQLHSLLEFTPEEAGLTILEGLVNNMIAGFDEALEQGLAQVPKGERDPQKIAAVIRSGPKYKKMEALTKYPDQFTAYILQLNPSGGLGFYDQLIKIKEFLEYVRQHPKLGKIPELILPLEPENKTRQELLTEIEAIFRIMQEKATDDSVVKYLLPPLQTFYWLYSKLPYPKQPAK